VRQDNGIGACYRCWPITQVSTWKQAAIAKWPRGVEEEDIEVTRQLHMLKSVIEDNNVHIEAL
jgi:hypothetical protein